MPLSTRAASTEGAGRPSNSLAAVKGGLSPTAGPGAGFETSAFENQAARSASLSAGFEAGGRPWNDHAITQAATAIGQKRARISRFSWVQSS